MKLLNSIKKDFYTMTWMLIPAIVINGVGYILNYQIQRTLQLQPSVSEGTYFVTSTLFIFLSSTGTILVAVICGPWAGALTGVLSEVFWGLVIDPTFFLPWWPTDFCIGFVAGWCARSGLFKSPRKVVLAGSLIAVSYHLISGVIWLNSNIPPFDMLKFMDFVFRPIHYGFHINMIAEIAASLLTFAIVQELAVYYWERFPRPENLPPGLGQQSKWNYGLFEMLLTDQVNRFPLQWRAVAKTIATILNVLRFLIELPLNLMAWLLVSIFKILRFLGYSIFYLITIVQARILRWAIKLRVDENMRISVDDPSGQELPDLAPAEIESGTQLESVIASASTQSEQNTVSRDFLLNKIKLLSRPLVGDLIAWMGYFLASIIVLVWLYRARYDPREYGILVISSLFAMNYLFVFLLAIVRYIDLYLQFFPKYVFHKMRFFHAFAYPWQQARRITWLISSGLLLVIGLCLDLSYGLMYLSFSTYPAGIVFFLAGGLHIFLYIRFRRKPTVENIRLLILRTFDIDKNTMFVFGRLAAFWERLGNYYTVVDRSLMHHKYDLSSPRGERLRALLGLFTALASIVIAVVIVIDGVNKNEVSIDRIDSFKAALPALSLISYLIGSIPALILLVLIEHRNIDRDFIKSRADVRSRIDEIEQKPRYINQSYKGLETMCHANTWKATVAELVKRTDVVLMDLRGFSPEKKGCEYELDFLLDHISLSRVVLLADANNSEYIAETARNLWKTLRTDSPNLGVTEPKIQIYVSGTEDELDVQGIFDHLIAAAILSGRASVEATVSKQVVATPIPASA